MSYDEYIVRMGVHWQRHEDDMERMHYQVWLSQRVVNATDRNGKYRIKKFRDFYKKKEIKPKKRVSAELYRVARTLQEYRRKEGDNERLFS